MRAAAVGFGSQAVSGHADFHQQLAQFRHAGAAIAAGLHASRDFGRRLEVVLAHGVADRVAAHAEARADRGPGIGCLFQRLAQQQADAVAVFQPALPEQLDSHARDGRSARVET
jgi:hypothetical protein